MKPALWNALTRTTKTPLRALVRRAFSEHSLERVWADFVPSAASVEQLTLEARQLDQAALIAAAAQALDRHGIVAVTGLVDPAAIGEAVSEIDAIIAQVQRESASGALHGEILGAVWQIGHSLLDTYFGMVGHAKPVILIRARDAHIADAGMIDIYQFDRLTRSAGLRAAQTIVEGEWWGVIANIAGRVIPTDRFTTNLYHNDGVTNTRGLHIDSLEPTIKAFLYLRDVTSLDDGPYTYVPGSQRERERLAKSVFLNRSRRLSECDIPILKGREVAMLAPAGTIIMSSQAGIHGGQPQSALGKRTAIVRNYLQSPRKRG